MHANFVTQDPRPVESVSTYEGLRFMAGRLWAYPFSLAVVILVSVGAAVSELISVGLVLPFLEAIRGTGSSSPILDGTPAAMFQAVFEGMSAGETVRAVAVGLVVAQGAKSLFTYLNVRLAYKLQVRIEMDLRLRVFDELSAAGLGFIHREQIASLFTILNNFTGNAAGIARAMIGVVAPLVTLGLLVSFLLALSWQLAVLGLGLAGGVMAFIGAFNQEVRRRGSRFSQAAVRLNHLAFESLSAVRLVRQFAREEHARERFERGVDDARERSYARGSLLALVGPLYIAASVLVLGVLLVVATFVLDQGDPGWVELIAIFMVVMFRLLGPSSNLTSTRAAVASQLPALASVIEFLRRRDKEVLPDGEGEFAGLRDGVRLEGVSFRYAAGEPLVLEDVSIAIPKGKATAIVGASGSGKTTLVSLLTRLYDPTAGRILVDGTDLRGLRSRTWRRRIGVVSQDTFLYNDTVRNNIRFGRLDATDAEIEEAAERANAHGFITELTDGYDTMVGDRGVRLSGGQAQRVAIARAILVDPDLLILDEATSSLDAESEQLVQEAIDRLSEQRTVLAVAHRLATVRNADNIIVLEGGRVVEQGTHDELIAKRGRYAQYVRLQDLGTNGGGRAAPEPTERPETLARQASHDPTSRESRT